MKVIVKGFDNLLTGLYFIVGIAVVIIMFCITYGIISRYFFSSSIGWTAEISGYVLIPLALLAAPKMLRDGGHIQIDLITNLISPKKKAALWLFASIVGTIVFIIICVVGFQITASMFASGYRTDTYLRVPRFILIGISAFGLGLIAVQFLRNIFRAIKILRGGEDIVPESEAM